MAVGKKTGGRDFEPGQSGNPDGRPKTPDDIKEARLINKIEVERLLNKFLEWPLEELVQFTQNKSSPVLETLIARVLLEAIKRGDQVRLNFLLDRLIGKVKDEIDHNIKGSIHAQIVDIINKVEGGNNGDKENTEEDDEA